MPIRPPPMQLGLEAGPSRRLLALVAGPVVALVVLLAPLPTLTLQQQKLASILSWVVLYWVLEPIPLPVTALLGTAFCVMAGLGSAKTIFAAYGHPIIFLFIGSFFLAEAMAVHGVDRRVAIWMLSRRWLADRPDRILLALGAATALISMWISNTAATALMLPVGLGLLSALRDAAEESIRRYQPGLLLMLSYAATAGGMATLIGTPPNLIGAGLIGEQAGVFISFVQWLAIGLPASVLMLLAAWGLLWWLHPSDLSTLPNLHSYTVNQRQALGPWTRGQMNACMAFSVAVILWVGPGALKAILGSQHDLVLQLDAWLPHELAALLAAGLLFVLPTDWRQGEFTLSWKQASGINWGILLLFGGGLAFGELMVQTGLSESVGKGFVTLLGVETVWGLTAVAIGIGVLISELASNTASASLLVPIVIAIAQAAGVSPVPPALGACLGASLGFALPVSTPTNAIVYGTALIPMNQMIRAGILFDVIGAILVWVTLRLLCPIVGFQ